MLMIRAAIATIRVNNSVLMQPPRIRFAFSPV
jgi:hypothetical protein